MKEIGMHYEAIHACPNDHVICYNQHEFAIECPECHVSRYRIDKVTKKVPQKVLRYIPIIPHFQLLFRCNNYYISIQNPMEKSDDAWISLFKLTKNHKDAFFFCKCGHKRRLSDG